MEGMPTGEEGEGEESSKRRGKEGGKQAVGNGYRWVWVWVWAHVLYIMYSVYALQCMYMHTVSSLLCLSQYLNSSMYMYMYPGGGSALWHYRQMYTHKYLTKTSQHVMYMYTSINCRHQSQNLNLATNESEFQIITFHRTATLAGSNCTHYSAHTTQASSTGRLTLPHRTVRPARKTSQECPPGETLQECSSLSSSSRECIDILISSTYGS